MPSMYQCPPLGSYLSHQEQDPWQNGLDPWAQILEIDDLKADRISAQEASKKQIEAARLLQVQVKSKVEDKSREMQQKMIAQHLQHKAELTELTAGSEAKIDAMRQKIADNALELKVFRIQRIIDLRSRLLALKKYVFHYPHPVIHECVCLMTMHEPSMLLKLKPLLGKYKDRESLLHQCLLQKYKG